MFVNNDIRKEMHKANVDTQFKKLYIYHMENVSILFADIKVSLYAYFEASKQKIFINYISLWNRASLSWLVKRQPSNWSKF